MYRTPNATATASAPPTSAAWRSATVLNTLTGKENYPLPRRTAFTTFGLDPQPHVPPARRPSTFTPLLDGR